MAPLQAWEEAQEMLLTEEKKRSLLSSVGITQNEVLLAFNYYPHIFNLGHGIGQEIDPDRVNTLVESVHALSAKYHS